MKTGFLGLIGLLIGVASGCSGSSSGTVTGKVSYAGKPLKGGTISFQSTARDSVPLTFPIDDAGQYTASDLPQGEYMVSVVPATENTTTSLNSANAVKRRMGELSESGQPVPPELAAIPTQAPGKETELFPPRYTDPFTSDLLFTLDAATKEYNLDLR